MKKPDIYITDGKHTHKLGIIAKCLIFLMIGTDSYVNSVCGKTRNGEDVIIKTQVAEAMKSRRPFIIIWIEGRISEENKEWLREELRGFDVHEIDSPPKPDASVLKKLGELFSLYHPNDILFKKVKEEVSHEQTEA